MRGTRLFVGLLVVSAMALGAGCFGPDEDPADTPEDQEGETETTPGDTVVGGQPTAEPTNDTAIAEAGTDTDTGEDAGGGDEATGGEEEADDEEGTEDGETAEGEETTADEGEG